MRCPVCGKELKLILWPGETYSRFIPGAQLDLLWLDDDEIAFAKPPCGWVVLKTKEGGYQRNAHTQAN